MSYPDNWKELSTAIKEASGWSGKRCLNPGEKHNLSVSARKSVTLQVHHWNRNPNDNRLENLVCLCSACHLSYHQWGRGNVSPGQLSLL